MNNFAENTRDFQTLDRHCGDFNAKVDSDPPKKHHWKCGWGDKNDSGEELLQFYSTNALKLMIQSTLPSKTKYQKGNGHHLPERYIT